MSAPIMKEVKGDGVKINLAMWEGSLGPAAARLSICRDIPGDNAAGAIHPALVPSYRDLFPV